MSDLETDLIRLLCSSENLVIGTGGAAGSNGLVPVKSQDGTRTVYAIAPSNWIPGPAVAYLDSESGLWHALVGQPTQRVRDDVVLQEKHLPTGEKQATITILGEMLTESAFPVACACPKWVPDGSGNCIPSCSASTGHGSYQDCINSLPSPTPEPGLYEAVYLINFSGPSSLYNARHPSTDDGNGRVGTDTTVRRGQGYLPTRSTNPIFGRIYTYDNQEQYYTNSEIYPPQPDASYIPPMDLPYYSSAGIYKFQGNGFTDLSGVFHPSGQPYYAVKAQEIYYAPDLGDAAYNWKRTIRYRIDAYIPDIESSVETSILYVKATLARRFRYPEEFPPPQSVSSRFYIQQNVQGSPINPRWSVSSEYTATLWYTEADPEFFTKPTEPPPPETDYLKAKRFFIFGDSARRAEPLVFEVLFNATEVYQAFLLVEGIRTGKLIIKSGLHKIGEAPGEGEPDTRPEEWCRITVISFNGNDYTTSTYSPNDEVELEGADWRTPYLKSFQAVVDDPELSPCLRQEINGGSLHLSGNRGNFFTSESDKVLTISPPEPSEDGEPVSNQLKVKVFRVRFEEEDDNCVVKVPQSGSGVKIYRLNKSAIEAEENFVEGSISLLNYQIYLKS